jgi:hypothetical protein
MRASLFLPRIIAIPIMLIIAVASVILFSVFFAILLIPVTIIGFKLWRAFKLAQKKQDGPIIEAQYVVIEKSEPDI